MTSSQSTVAPLLVFGWGNLSRGDDALGPLCLEHLRDVLADFSAVEYLEDYQLQIEHALDLVGRLRVLFIDASLTCQVPFEVSQLQAVQDESFTTHAMSPQAVMHVFRQLQGKEPPPCTLLAIRGERFELGEAPSPNAMLNLAAAQQWAQAWLETPAPEAFPCMN